jgi:hypothetical protein
MNRAVLSRTMAKPAENRNRATVAAVNCRHCHVVECVDI